ncbi:PREDICTED: uncharacterized protein LOC104605241 [Nelumbo nucifera]|uniref:Uncharacterized protein LOC104605241 n=2 Tax=Nelumbo nucifera TaxID=4432 RepID=A0A1U8ALJ9_NELNU|nr:PREDICTED: uncharacterized protein LOC104605241 [Nelumbo nucifera]DAD41158.1 TPA_asm: hypothetical protein HUJ06_015481 [Nelumbo nucifera]
MAELETKPEGKHRKKKRKLSNTETDKRGSEASRLEKENELNEEGRKESNLNTKQGGSWKNLDLILFLQNKELEVQRKVEFAFQFVNSRINSQGDGANGCSEMVSISRLIVFLSEWIQSVLISSDKKIMVEGKKPHSGVMEACLDSRCWVIFKFCLEESAKLHISLSFLPNLLGAISCVAVDALSVVRDMAQQEKELVFIGEGFELYSLVADCVSLLFSSCGRVFHASIEPWPSIVMSMIDIVQEIYSRKLASSNVGFILLRLSCLVLDLFTSFLSVRVLPNPKNVFRVFIKRLLEPLMSLFVMLDLQTDDTNSVWTGNLLKIVKDILSNGLFHAAHMDGFLSTRSTENYIESHSIKIKAMEKKDMKAVARSYHRHFFEKLETIMAEKKMSALGGLGELFHLIVIRVKKQKGVSVFSEGSNDTIGITGVPRHLEGYNKDFRSRNSVGSSNTVIAKTNLSSRLDAETSKSLFDLFVRFMEPLVLDLERHSKNTLEAGPMLLDAYCTLRSANKILYVFMHERVYVRTEDTSEGACLNFLKEVYSTIISFSAQIHQFWLESKIYEGRDMEMPILIAKEIISVLSYLLEIEYEVTGNDLVSLWLMMLSFSAIELSLIDTPYQCGLISDIQHFGCQLIHIYSELRQVHVPLFALCKAVRVWGNSRNDGFSRFVFFPTLSLPSETCVESVVMLVCSQNFRISISNAVKSTPEGQVSGCIKQLQTDISESLELIKVCILRASGQESGESEMPSCSMSLHPHTELLGGVLSEIYTLVLDSSTVTMGNSILVGSSVKDIMTIIRPTLSYLAGEQPVSVHEFLFSVTGKTFSNDEMHQCRNDLPTLPYSVSWILLFSFRLYISCRSLFKQTISLMPPNSSKKMSATMGDLFTACCGKDWIDRNDWMDEGYFSCVIKSSTSLLTIIQSVSDVFLQESGIGCAPLIYVMHAMSFQRLVDLNRQIKAVEFLQERAAKLEKTKSMDDDGSCLSLKESKKWKRCISVLREESAGLTSFLMSYLSLIAKKVSFSPSKYVTCESKEAEGMWEDNEWDLCVSSVNEKSLPTAIWWILCQNTDIWCIHASKKKTKKFLLLLFYNFLSSVRSNSTDIEKQNMDKTLHPRTVTMQQISLKLLRDNVLYEQTILCRHLTSRFCRTLEKSISPFLICTSFKSFDFNLPPDWGTDVSMLENLNSTHGMHDGSSLSEPDSFQSCLSIEHHNGEKASSLTSMELTACQNLLDLLCWMPKCHANSRSLLIYATYILNLEKFVICSLLNVQGKLFLNSCYELFRLFLSCRRALKYLVMVSCEETIGAQESSLVSILFDSSFSVIWLLKSVSAIGGFSYSLLGEQASQMKDIFFSLMDHTSYVFLTLIKHQSGLAIGSLTYERPQLKLPNFVLLREQNNIIEAEPSDDFSKQFDTWKVVILVAKALKEQTKSVLDALKNNSCNTKLEAGVSVADLNKLSSTVSCFQGFLWGLASSLNSIDEKCCPVKTKSLIQKLGHMSEISLCISVCEDFMNFCLRKLLFENGQQPQGLSDLHNLPKIDHLTGSLIFKESLNISGDEIMNSSGKQEENFPGRMDGSASETDDDHESTKNSDVKSSSFQEEGLQIDHAECAVSILTAVDSFELEHLKKSLVCGLLKGENPEVAFLVRQLFIASSAILGLKLLIDFNPLSSTLTPLFIGISQFVLLEFADMVEVPHSFSFVWLDGILKYLEVLGNNFSITNPTSSRNVYAKLVDIHLRAIGRCISLQGKRATLASHDTESSTKTLQGQMEPLGSSLCHGPYNLDEFKARLRMSFKVLIRKPLELHLLSAMQAIERALVGVQEGCNMIYEIHTGSQDGGKVSPVVAAGVDCLDSILESVSGRKRLSVVKRHIQSLVGALFNIILHLQGTLIFYKKVTSNHGHVNPDPGSVILMCIEVLTKVAGRHALFQMDSSHVAQCLHTPAALFKDFHELRTSQGSGDQDSRHVACMSSNIVDQQFSIDLFSACCRLVCAVLRHHKGESERCIALLEDSVFVLLRCLETVDTDLVASKGYFAWEVEEGVKCASFLRRIYEEIRQQKDVLGRYSFLFLSNYIWIYSGYGPFKTGIRREIDEALRPGVYALIDACSADDLQQLHTVLGEGPCRSTLATLQHDYKLNFQYEGKV